MNRFVVLGPLLVATSVTSGACAQILAYDDYRERSALNDGALADARDQGVDVDAEPGPARPPPRPAGPATPSGTGRDLWVAAKRMYVGSQTSLGVNSPDGWREFGFDLDSVCTSQQDSIRNVGTCQRHPEANQDFLVDGFQCRDNNFGHHVIPLVVVSTGGFESRLNDGIYDGSSTWILRILDVDDGPNDGYAPGMLYRSGTEKKKILKWDGTDVRTVQADSVVERDLGKPIAHFTKGYIRDDVWVSGEPELRQVILPVTEGLYVAMTLEAAVMTLTLAADHRSGTRGHLGGAIPIGSIESLLKPIATSSGLCPGSTVYNSLIRNVQRFPDVVIGAPNLQNTSIQCDGVSIGMAFDMAPIQPVTAIVDPPATPDMCADAGADTAPMDTGPSDSESDTGTIDSATGMDTAVTDTGTADTTTGPDTKPLDGTDSTVDGKSGDSLVDAGDTSASDTR